MTFAKSKTSEDKILFGSPEPLRSEEQYQGVCTFFGGIRDYAAGINHAGAQEPGVKVVPTVIVPADLLFIYAGLSVGSTCVPEDGEDYLGIWYARLPLV